MLRRLASRLDPLALVLAAVVLASAIYSVEAAGWVEDLPHPTLNGLAAVLLGSLLAAAGLRPALAFLLAVPVGALAIVWQVSYILVGRDWWERLVDLALRMNAWGYAARTGGISTDYLPFFLLLLCFAWIGGCAIGWSTSRGRRPWWAIGLSGVALLMNLHYAPPRLGIFFLVYIVSALLLVVRLNQTGPDAPSRSAGTVSMFTVSGALAVALALAVWFVPTPRESPDMLNMWYRVNTPWQDGLGQVNRLFAFLVSKERPGPGDFDKTLVIRGTSNLSDEPVMMVESAMPRYWRGLSYDYYTGQGWLVQDQSPVRLPGPPAERPGLLAQYQATREVTQTVTVLSPKNNLVFAAGAIRGLGDLDAGFETTRASPVMLNTSTLGQPESLPLEFRQYAGALRESLAAINPRMEEGRIVTTINSRLPQGVRVTEVIRGDGGRILGVQAVTRYPVDVTAVYASSPLQIGQKYTALSAISEVAPDRLREAGDEYPAWVTERYLQLPPSLPQRVSDLSRDLTEESETPYEKALAIESYLRTFVYSTNLPMPPGNIDRVDYMLFTLKKGYSAYFSTTMVVMLRSVGVPARIVTGYTTGALDAERGGYLVKESNAHGWVEVYFPRYGWIEFEPTPSLPSMARPADGDTDDPLDDDLFELPNVPEEPVENVPGEALSSDSPVGGSGWPFWFLAVPLLAIGAWITWGRYWRTMDPAVAAYGKMSLFASIARLRPRSDQTPREYGSVMKRTLPRQQGQIDGILNNYERVRYGGRPSTSEDAGRLEQYWQALRAALLRRIFTPGGNDRDR